MSILSFRKQPSTQVDYTQARTFHCFEILSGCATQLNQEGKLRELVALQQLAALSYEKARHCTQLDHFYHPGIEEDGDHLCLALRLEQASLDPVWDKYKGLPVLFVKRVVRHVLDDLSVLHAGEIRNVLQ